MAYLVFLNRRMRYLKDMGNQVGLGVSYKMRFILVCRVETVSGAIIAFMRKNHFKSNPRSQLLLNN